MRVEQSAREEPVNEDPVNENLKKESRNDESRKARVTEELLAHARCLLLSVGEDDEVEVRVAAARAMIDLAQVMQGGKRPAPHPMLDESEVSSESPVLTMADDPSFGD